MTALIFLPAVPIHSPDWADTRDPRSVIRVHSSGLEASLGEEASLLGQDLANGLRWRVGLEAGAFMAFEPEGELTFSLLTFDGTFGVPLDFGWRDWTIRLEWTHLSAHFADGIRHGSELPDSSQLGPFSREWVGLRLGHRMGLFQTYIGSRRIVHSADGGSGATAQIGTTVNGRSSPGLYGGVDFQSRQELDWALTSAGEVGIQWFGKGGGLQLGLCGYTGMNDAGKKFGEREQYLGLSFGLQPPLLLR